MEMARYCHSMLYGGVRKLAWACLLVAMSASAHAQCFADRLVSVIPGINGGFGAANLPDNVLGPPNGTGSAQTPNASPTDLFTLGTGGEIVLAFDHNRIIDQPGPDLIVFENPVQPLGFPDQSYVECATVSASADGISWHTFPFSIDSTATQDLKLKSNYHGLAGVNATLSSPSNGLSPFDPASGGGDGFDLADVGLSSAKYIRINDTGTTAIGSNNIPISDYGNLLDPPPDQPGVSTTAGFDLDAVSAIHSTSETSAIDPGEWMLYDPK